MTEWCLFACTKSRLSSAHPNNVSTFQVQFVWFSWYLVDANVENTLMWQLRCNSWSVSSLFALAIKPLFRCIGNTGSSVGLALAYWSSGPSSIPAQGEIFSTVNGIPLHTTIHYRPPIVLIWLKYYLKGRKITSHLSIHPMHGPYTRKTFVWSHALPAHVQIPAKITVGKSSQAWRKDLVS